MKHRLIWVMLVSLVFSVQALAASPEIQCTAMVEHSDDPSVYDRISLQKILLQPSGSPMYEAKTDRYRFAVVYQSGDNSALMGIYRSDTNDVIAESDQTIRRGYENSVAGKADGIFLKIDCE